MTGDSFHAFAFPKVGLRQTQNTNSSSLTLKDVRETTNFRVISESTFLSVTEQYLLTNAPFRIYLLRPFMLGILMVPLSLHLCSYVGLCPFIGSLSLSLSLFSFQSRERDSIVHYVCQSVCRSVGPKSLYFFLLFSAFE